MTSRPRLFTEANYLNGFAALLLFAVLAVVFVGAGFPVPEGFGDGSVTATIGYALFDMTDQAAHESESFLVAFLVIAVVLDAALDGAVMLARRDDEEGLATALADGGRRLRGVPADGGDSAGTDAHTEDGAGRGADSGTGGGDGLESGGET
jgi:NADH-quinone oxidoreductase subunit J